MLNAVRKKIALVGILAVTIACASFQKEVLDKGNIAYETLNSISNTADVIMNPVQRKEFAAKYMVPAVTSLDELITIAKAYKHGDPIPAQFLTLGKLIVDAIAHIKATFPNENELVGKLNKFNSDLNSFKASMEGK